MSWFLALLLALASGSASLPQDATDQEHELRQASQRRALLDQALKDLRRALLEGGGEHFEVARTLACLEAEREAAEVLFELLDFGLDPHVQLRALQALDILGEAGTRAMVEAVDARHSWRVEHAYTGRSDRLEAHLALLGHPDDRLRQSAERALAGMGSKAAEALSRRVDGDGAGELRELVARWRGSEQALADVENPGRRKQLQRALEKLGPALESDRAALVEVARRFRRLGGESLAIPALVDALASEDDLVRGRAFEALEELGPAATEAIVREALAGVTWWLRHWMIGRADQVEDHLPLLEHPDEAIARGAAVALSNMGAPAALELARLARSSSRETRLTAIRAARAFGEHAEPLLVPLNEALASGDARERRAAAYALGGLVPASLPQLLEALDDPDRAARREAAEGIVRSMPWRGPAVPAAEVEAYRTWHGGEPGRRDDADRAYSVLARSARVLAAHLDDEDPETRVHLAQALARLGADAAPALALLDRHGHDPSPAVAFWIDRARVAAAPAPFARLRELAAAVGAPTEAALDAQESALALHALEHGTAWELETPPEGDALSMPETPDERFEAALELTRTGLEGWLAAAEGEGPKADAARSVLLTIEREVARHVADLVRLLDDEWGRGGPAARELARLGPAALPELTHDFLRFPRFPIGPPTYCELEWVLEEIGPASVPALTLGLEHWTVWGREYAARGLLALGEGALPAVPAVVSAWRSGGYGLAFPGTDTWWGELGPELMAAVGPGATPWLVTALVDEHPSVRVLAARSLAALGPAEEDVRRALFRNLADADPEARAAAAEALLRLADPDSPEAVAARRVLG